MTQPIPDFVLENWNLDYVAILAEMAPGEERAAEEWWRSAAPVIYQMLLEALPYEGDGWPDSAEEWELLIQEEELGILPIPAEELSVRQSRLAHAAAMGVLIFWSVDSNRYYQQNGALVRTATQRAIVDQVLRRAAPNVEMLASRLRDGAITPAEWRAAMAEHIKRTSWDVGLAASGGRYAMQPWQRSLIEQHVAEQLRYLNRRYQAILSGEQLLDGTILRRALMYNSAARGLFFGAESALLSQQFDTYRNVLTAVESCTGSGSCVEETAKGYVPIGTLTPIGSRLCLSNCKCYFEYMNSVTGEVRG